MRCEFCISFDFKLVESYLELFCPRVNAYTEEFLSLGSS
jgi:hypothetical protein